MKSRLVLSVSTLVLALYSVVFAAPCTPDASNPAYHDSCDQNMAVCKFPLPSGCSIVGVTPCEHVYCEALSTCPGVPSYQKNNDHVKK